MGVQPTNTTEGPLQTVKKRVTFPVWFIIRHTESLNDEADFLELVCVFKNQALAINWMSEYDEEERVQYHLLESSVDLMLTITKFYLL